MDCDIIHFGIGFTGLAPPDGPDVISVLKFVDEMYREDDENLREIVSAQIVMGSPSAAFQILFRDFEGSEATTYYIEGMCPKSSSDKMLDNILIQDE